MSERVESDFFLACDQRNDLLLAMRAAGLRVQRYDDPGSAIAAAPAGSPVLLLATDYPEKTVAVSAAAWEQAKAKSLRVYVEYSDGVPGWSVGSPRKTVWERFVISGDRLGDELPKGRILMAHDCVVLPAAAAEALVVVGRVAGYNHAVYGIPASAEGVLVEIDGGRVLVAATMLSNFRTGRFAPAGEWQALWNFILGHLAGRELPKLTWTSTVETMYGPEGQLPADYEKRALATAAEWCHSSGLLVSESRAGLVGELLKKGQELVETEPGEIGDGRFGILEGYASNIRRNGDQPQRCVIRADCQAESAMVLAIDWKRGGKGRNREVAANLLDFVYFESDLCKGGRGDVGHPAYGLIGWGSTTPAWMVANYGDDNARVMLATMLAGAALGTDRWDEPLLRGLLANLRTTGKLGFRGDRIDMPQLERDGWRHYHDAETVNFSPHFESYNWACFLWAYRHTGYREFLDRTKIGIRMMMEAYPDKWRWGDNIERGRMLLCLAWLVRLEDTAEHRGWLRRIIDDLMAIQHDSGALPESFYAKPGGHYQVPQTNEAYGTTEAPLLQENGDPVSDQLYLGGFALIGLHEAAAAMNDPKIAAVEDRLAEYLCRIQIRSKELPQLEGAWFRAFDFERWEPWASSGDAGWGAWSTEAGWAQAWGAATLGLRGEGKSLWDFTAGSKIGSRLEEVQKQMAGNDGGPWRG